MAGNHRCTECPRIPLVFIWGPQRNPPGEKAPKQCFSSGLGWVPRARPPAPNSTGRIEGMEYELWNPGTARVSVSKKKGSPGPVAGYLLRGNDGKWAIEGDPEPYSYETPEQAAEALLLRGKRQWRSEEHTSELQSLRHLVCRL